MSKAMRLNKKEITTNIIYLKIIIKKFEVDINSKTIKEEDIDYAKKQINILRSIKSKLKEQCARFKNLQ